MHRRGWGRTVHVWGGCTEIRQKARSGVWEGGAGDEGSGEMGWPGACLQPWEPLERVWILCPGQWGVSGARKCHIQILISERSQSPVQHPPWREARLEDQRLGNWVRAIQVTVQGNLLTSRAGPGFGTSRTSFGSRPFSDPHCSFSSGATAFSNLI